MNRLIQSEYVKSNELCTCSAVLTLKIAEPLTDISPYFSPVLSIWAVQYILDPSRSSTLKGSAKPGPSLSVTAKCTRRGSWLQSFNGVSSIVGALSFTSSSSIRMVPVPVAGISSDNPKQDTFIKRSNEEVN